MFVIGLLLITAFSVLSRVIIDNYINDKVKTGSRATLLSFSSFIMGAVKAIGLLAVGAMVGVMPLYLALSVVSIIVLIITLTIFLPGLRHVKAQ